MQVTANVAAPIGKSWSGEESAKACPLPLQNQYAQGSAVISQGGKPSHETCFAGDTSLAFPPLVFFHVGKTGGTALITFFETASPSCLIEDSSDGVDGIEAVLGGKPAAFVAGHYAIAPLLPLIPADWLTMTVIRDPLWHLPSQYWHLRTLSEQAADPDMRRLIEACKNHDFAWIVASADEPAFARHFDNPQTRAVTGKKSGPVTWRDLVEARDILSRLSFVGTTERIDALAAYVASALPWAHGLQGRKLPYVMVNPHNEAGVPELPTHVAARLHALTELDRQLHRYAESLRQRYQPAVQMDACGAAAIRSSTLPVADLVRVYASEHARVALGEKLRIWRNEVLLHPPAGPEGSASLTMDAIPLRGQGTISGRVLLAHAASPPVRFDIELASHGAHLADASFVLGAGHPLEFRLTFPASSGPGQLKLATRMASPETGNSFAWATFADVVLS